MTARKEETKPELEQKLKDQLQDATPTPTPTPTPKPTPPKDTTTITINGNIVVNGDNIGAIINATTIIFQPTITINLTTPKITHYLAQLMRQIKRKTATHTQKLRQITRNPKNRPNPPSTPTIPPLPAKSRQIHYYAKYPASAHQLCF